jgi:hypothetical protein
MIADSDHDSSPPGFHGLRFPDQDFLFSQQLHLMLDIFPSGGKLLGIYFTGGME